MRPVTKVVPPPAPGYDSATLTHNFAAPVPAVLTGLAPPLPCPLGGPTYDTIARAVEYFRTHPPAAGTPAEDARDRLRGFISSPPVGEGYKAAALPLRGNLGRYCSYCEVKDDTSSLAVEHIVPKGEYPSWALDWDNFLLGCFNCNTSFKGTRPARATATGWGGAGGLNPTEAQLRARILARYRWPHRAASSYRGVRYKLYTVTPAGGLVEITGNKAVFGVRNSQTNNGSVTAQVQPAGAGVAVWPRHEVVVRVVSRPGANNPNPQELITLTGLNQQAAGGGDGRVAARTEAWIIAAEAVRNLRDTLVGIPAAQAGQVFAGLWFAIVHGALAGFYSVWLSVLERAPAINGVNLAPQFINDTAVPPPPPAQPLFPGTNAALL